MKKKHFIATTIVLAVILLDQSTKLYIERGLPIHDPITVIEDFLHIVHVRNTGAAFGIMADQGLFIRVFFILVSIAAIFIIPFFLMKLKDHQIVPITGLSLVMAGAIGNLIDRIRLGEVIDFIDLHWYSYHWPTFNLADSAITIGGILLIIEILFIKEAF